MDYFRVQNYPVWIFNLFILPILYNMLIVNVLWMNEWSMRCILLFLNFCCNKNFNQTHTREIIGTRIIGKINRFTSHTTNNDALNDLKIKKIWLNFFIDWHTLFMNYNMNGHYEESTRLLGTVAVDAAWRRPMWRSKERTMKNEFSLPRQTEFIEKFYCRRFHIELDLSVCALLQTVCSVYRSLPYQKCLVVFWLAIHTNMHYVYNMYTK